MALIRWQPPVLRHESAEPHRVAWIELFFDLVYVAALIQVGDALADDVSWTGVIRFAGIFVLLWWTWVGTTLLVNRFSVDDVTHRLLVFAQMFGVGNVALVAVAPLADRARWLVVAYVAARIPLLLMYWRVRRHIPQGRAIAELYLRVFGLGTVLFLASLLVPTPWRFGVWAVAIAMEFGAPIAGIKKTEPPPLEDEHLSERFSVFTIIVLGESFVKILTELAGEGISLTTQVLGGMIFLVGASLWWTYFDDVADSDLLPGRDRIAGSLKRVSWIYGHLPLAAGLTAFGVASKKMVTVEGLGATITPRYLYLFAGAAGLAFLATALLDRVTISPHFGVSDATRVGPRLLAAGAIAVVSLTLTTAPALLVLFVIAVIAVGQLSAEIIVAARAEQRVAEAVRAMAAAGGGACEELVRAVPLDDGLDGEDDGAPVCRSCEAHGVPWVQVRRCLSCGHVGCCDDSPGRHGTAHFQETGHPVMESAEPGATWAYCFVHGVTAADGVAAVTAR